MQYVINLILTYKYVLILPLAIIEGPVLALVCGVLLRLGLLSFLPLFICLMLGDVGSDIYWYWIGYHGGRKFANKFGKYVSITEGHLERLEIFYNKHYKWILFLSKLTMGLGFAVYIVAMAGVAKVPFKKYMLINILGQPVWTAILLSVGYFLGDFYLRLNKGFEIAWFTAGVVVVGLLLWGFSRYLRQRVIEKYVL